MVDDELLKYAEMDDIWFHVNDLSSAHVYLKMQPGWTIASIPEALVVDCCQLVKANSIEGTKLDNVRVVYTPVSNLKKEAGFNTGAVTFHSTKKLRYATVPKKLNEIVNRLAKTKEERVVDFQKEKLDRAKEEHARRRTEEAAAKEASLREDRRRREEAELKSYGSVLKSERMTTNKHDGPVDIDAFEEDFFG